MTLELVSFQTPDKLELPGLLYQPDQPTKSAVVWLHGMGDSGIFYHPYRVNVLGQQLAQEKIALFAFNNRGAHNSKTIRIIDETLPEDDRGYQGGTHYEKIVDSVQDIDGAVKFLHDKGFTKLYLAGHSTGANKVCAYDAQVNPTPFSAYILAGPGDDTGIFYSELGDENFHKALKYAKSALKAGKPYQTMPRYTGMHPFSAQAAYDILDPDGAYNTFPFYEVTTKRLGSKPLFQEYSNITIPTLIIFGENDEYAFTAGNTTKALEIFKHYTNKKARQTSYMLVKGADHSFHDREEVFAEMMSSWLGKQNV